MKRKGKQMVTAVLSTAMLFTMSSMPVYAEENVEAQINEIDGVGTSVDSLQFAIGKIQPTEGQVGQAYSEMLSMKEGSASSWEIVDGSLPAGLNLDKATGKISGIPEEAGSFVFTVKAVSAEDETVSDEAEFSIEITEGKGDYSQPADGLIQDTTNLADGITTFGLNDAKSMEVVQVDVSTETSTDSRYTIESNRIVFKDSNVIYELTGTTDKYLAFWIPNEPEEYHLRLNNVTVNGGLTNGSEGGSTYVDVEVPEGTENYLSEIKANDLTIHGSGTINTTFFTINQKPAGGNLSSSLHITDTTIVVETKASGSNSWEGAVVLDGNANVTMTGNDINPVLKVGQGPNETASVTLRDNASLKCLQENMDTPYENIVDGIQLNDSSLSLEDNSYLEAEGKSSTNAYGSGSAIISNVDVTVADQAEMELRAYGVALSTWGSVILNGGTTKVESYGSNAIYAGGDLEVDGGILNAATTAWYPAIYTDGEILIQNHAEVTAEGGNNAIWGVSGVTIEDSTVTSTSTMSDTAIYSGNNFMIKSSAIKVDSEGEYSIYEYGRLSIKDSWVESFGGKVDDSPSYTTWENMVSFQDNVGTVIGNPSILDDVEMTADMRLTIPANTSLTVPADKTLTNSGAIENIGGIKNDGTISNDGTITNKVINMNLPDSLTLKTGNTQSFTDYVTYGAITGNAVTGTAPINDCTWSSDKQEIASVENGVVTAKTAGTAVITASAENMQDTCTITVQKKSSSGGSSSGSITTENTNPDGSTTTTETKPDGTKVETTVKDDGTKVETTTRPDGSKTEVTTEPDGTKTTVDTAKDETVTTTVEKPDGSKTETKEEPNGTVTTTETDKDGNQKETVEKSDGTTTTTYDNVDGTYSVTVADADGNTKSEVTLTEEAILKAAEEQESISLPMPELPLTDDKEKAPVVTVSLPENTEVAVEIPVEDVTAGTVAVLVDENGTETIIKTTVSTENGILVKLADGDTIKVVENSKEFDDVPEGYWGYEAVQFVSSRELFAGTGDAVFSPDAPMTRAMVWTV